MKKLPPFVRQTTSGTGKRDAVWFGDNEIAQCPDEKTAATVASAFACLQEWAENTMICPGTDISCPAKNCHCWACDRTRDSIRIMDSLYR